MFAFEGINMIKPNMFKLIDIS